MEETGAELNQRVEEVHTHHESAKARIEKNPIQIKTTQEADLTVNTGNTAETIQAVPTENSIGMKEESFVESVGDTHQELSPLAQTWTEFLDGNIPASELDGKLTELQRPATGELQAKFISELKAQYDRGEITNAQFKEKADQIDIAPESVLSPEKLDVARLPERPSQFDRLFMIEDVHRFIGTDPSKLKSFAELRESIGALGHSMRDYITVHGKPKKSIMEIVGTDRYRLDQWYELSGVDKKGNEYTISTARDGMVALTVKEWKGDKFNNGYTVYIPSETNTELLPPYAFAAIDRRHEQPKIYCPMKTPQDANTQQQYAEMLRSSVQLAAFVANGK